jgi:hypothetical protein
MRIKDIACRLDMKMKLMINDPSDLFRLSKLHNITFTIFLKKDGNDKKYYYEAFIAKKYVEENIVEIIRSYSPVETENYYMISRPVISPKILDLIKELWDTPSLQFSEITVEEGKMVIRVRYNSLYKKQLSLVLNKYLVIPYFIDDMLMKKSEDVVFLMNKKNKRTPLSIIQYSLPLSIHNIDYPTKVIMEQDALAEVVENPYCQSNFRIIIFSNEELKEQENFVCLSKKDLLYQTESTNELLNAIKDRANAHGIFRGNIIIKYKNNRLYSSSVISSSRLNEYLEIMFSASRELYGKNIIDMHVCTDFDVDVYGEL